MKKAAAIALSLVLAFPAVGLAKKTSSSKTSKSHQSGETHSSKTHQSGKTHVTTTDSKTPNGAKARCSDGTYSTASGRGACSHHRGVDAWLSNQP